MRQYFRHPTDMPVDLVPSQASQVPKQRLHNISLGGVACNCNRAFINGTPIEIRIPLLGSLQGGEHASCYGLIAWCQPQGDGFVVGVTFTDEENLFRLRMIEQICQIEHYRREREQLLGRKVTVEEVAQDWIEQFASSYSRDSLN
ncbi:PilZ domain-containing protein [Pseudomonas sp. 5P_3.1_Bac2]|uniref:PilZ domain-containing protein n=1 Tax=Pseudomonas sp. 5P_3.1_Bac2 TaxID=2971617 RepID=UPI0021C9EF4E|nr:PilZ domain-containing protein [Pseudomonas sp. 5P_3.1_Bac2]MCU1716183.1 PilZ domain-containing protein [Pseudomonas sp. 5P_3.1_Bac2]